MYLLVLLKITIITIKLYLEKEKYKMMNKEDKKFNQLSSKLSTYVTKASNMNRRKIRFNQVSLQDSSLDRSEHSTGVDI